MFLSDLDEALAQAFLTTDKMFLDKARTEVLFVHFDFFEEKIS